MVSLDPLLMESEETRAVVSSSDSAPSSSTTSEVLSGTSPSSQFSASSHEVDVALFENKDSA